MHVAPVDLRAVRQDGILIRFALLGSMAYVFAEIPATGSAGTSLERPCTDAHWAFVIEGQLTFVTDRKREVIPAGSAFHVPAGGPEHHFETDGPATVAGFAPVEPEADLSDERLLAQGFDLVSGGGPSTIVPAVAARRIGAGQIQAEAWPMSSYVLNRVRLGERSGFTSAWCDAPHWGMVTSGRLTFEWEDNVEVLVAGDVFHCPAGPPGHRVEAADPSTFIDLTPLSAYSASLRLSDWRRSVAPAPGKRSSGISVAALA